MIPAPTTGRAVRAEWIKTSTLRSTWLTTGAAIAVALTFAVLGYHSAMHQWPGWSPAAQASYDPVRAGFSGPIDLMVLAMGTLGVLTATAEYGTGTIRTTFTATPRRLHVLTAKTLIVAAGTLTVGEATAFAIFETGQHLTAGTSAHTHLAAPGVARAVVGAGLFLTGAALTGLGLGFVIRRTAGALAAFYGLFYIAPLLLGAISDTLAKAALTAVSNSIFATHAPPPGRIVPSVPAAFTILAGYVVLSLGAAYLTVRKRDA